MRIISNNKTKNSSDYLEKKKNIINYNNVITEEPNIFNSKTKNFKINNSNKIIQYKSYDLFNNINEIKSNFNPKCWELPKKTMTLTNGKISIYNPSQNYITNNCDTYNIVYENKNDIDQNCIQNYININNIDYNPDTNPDTNLNTNFTNLDLMLNGTYNPIGDFSYASWFGDFSIIYTLSNPVTISYDQLFWNGKAFIANGGGFEGSGNLIYKQSINNYWNFEEYFNKSSDIYLPVQDTLHKFITFKKDVPEKFYESNIILITVYNYDNSYNTYSKLELGKQFIMYICEENSYYDVSNSGNNGYSGWLNASEKYDPMSFKTSIKNGSGCYNNLDQYYTNIESNQYELYIPLLNTRSTTAIYIKIGLPIDSSNNIGKVTFSMPIYL